MKAVNIEWDVTDGAEDMAQEEINEVLETLPTEIELPDEIAIDEDGKIDYDGIDDYLSDETGFCHNGYVLEGIIMSTVEKVKEYFETINLNHYDLGGCEFQDDDFETIAKRVDAGQGTIESVTDDYLYDVREILDEGLEDIEE